MGLIGFPLRSKPRPELLLVDGLLHSFTRARDVFLCARVPPTADLKRAPPLATRAEFNRSAPQGVRAALSRGETHACAQAKRVKSTCRKLRLNLFTRPHRLRAAAALTPCSPRCRRVHKMVHRRVVGVSHTQVLHIRVCVAHCVLSKPHKEAECIRSRRGKP